VVQRGVVWCGVDGCRDRGNAVHQQRAGRAAGGQHCTRVVCTRLHSTQNSPVLERDGASEGVKVLQQPPHAQEAPGVAVLWVAQWCGAHGAVHSQGRACGGAPVNRGGVH
jgi:hypothetical protein